MEWDIENPAHRRVLLTARAWGVSPSRFMGVKQETIVQEYNGQTVHVTLSEWTEEDRAAAIALQDYEASLCGGCGRPLAETTDPQMEYGYKAQLPIRCHYCTAAAAMQEEYAENPHPHALMFPVVKRSEG